jgi:hypothetical protein
MQDDYYPVEIKICSKNGWHTPQEAQAYYGRYSREGITWYWWGDGTGADNHDNIVNYIAGKATAGTGSVNYVLSDRKITLMVSPDNVAWASQAGNPTTISVELQPTLSAEGYKRAGWLMWQLEGRYNKRLSYYGHNHWFSTQCPGTIDMNRIRGEADKWASGGYLPAPTPVIPPVVPPVPTIQLTYSKLPIPVNYTINKDTSLWNFNATTWAGITKVKDLKKGEQYIVYGIGDNNTLHSHYGMTSYSFGNADTTGSPKATNGVNMADLDLTPALTPPPTPEAPTPTPPAVPIEVPIPPITQSDLPIPNDSEGADSWLRRIFAWILQMLSNFKFRKG